MARPKNQARRREALMDAAQRAIATRGLGALRLRDIADEAGVTGPAVSYYYPDIDELLVDVYSRAIRQWMERGPVAVSEVDDPWDQIVAGIEADLPSGPSDTDAVIMYQFSGDPTLAGTYGAMSAALRASQISLYRSIIDTGIALGRFHPEIGSPTAARAITALGDAYGLQVVVQEPGMSKPTALGEIIRIVASLLRVEDGAVGRIASDSAAL